MIGQERLHWWSRSFSFHLSNWDMVLLDVNNIRGRQTDLDKKVSNYIKSLSIVIDDSQLGLEVNYWWRLQNLKESQVTVLYADWLCSCPPPGSGWFVKHIRRHITSDTLLLLLLFMFSTYNKLLLFICEPWLDTVFGLLTWFIILY